MSEKPNLNPGIVKTVRILNDAGFRTCDSGDGETHDFECDQDAPYVHMMVAPDMIAAEARRLMALLREHGVGAGDGGGTTVNGKGDKNNRVKNWSKYRSEIDRIFKKQPTNKTKIQNGKSK